MNEKEKIIKEAYGHSFGTAYGTYNIVVEKSAHTRLQEVKDYSNKRDDIQVNFKYKKLEWLRQPR